MGVLFVYVVIGVNPCVARNPTKVEMNRFRRFVCVIGAFAFGTTLNPLLYQVLGILCIVRGSDSNNPLPWVMCNGSGGGLLIGVGFATLPLVVYSVRRLVTAAKVGSVEECKRHLREND